MATGEVSEPFGAVLQRQRLLAGLSQAELAERAGLSRRGITDLERGARRTPHPATASRLAEALNLPQAERALLLVAARRHQPAAEDSSPSTDAHRANAGQAATAGSARARLPTQLTSFIGRRRELADARRLLPSTRLLTLTGPGGSGKTRLGLQLAAEVAADFPDGVWFVPLAPIRDPALVLPSIALILGLQDSRERPLVEYLTSHLREKVALLVLDNFEQLLPAAPVLAQLLRETSTLKLMVTSRACLRVSGEQEFAVSPLALPDPRRPLPVASVADCESIQLFVERARAALPGFAVTDQNAACLTRLVSRLDGLPLAIELAAARVKLLPPEAMLPRLEHSLGLLVAGARDRPQRQQTLRSTIAWSYGLLSPGARRLLAACAVFRGGASLERIESVCQATGAIGDAVLDALGELVDHSLLLRVEAPAGPRFVLLETIREYAAERLAELPEEAQIRERHAADFLALAEEAERQLAGPGEKEWLELLDLEHNNLRAASDWYGRTAPELALRLAVTLRPFWSARGQYTEGRQRLRSLLERIAQRTPLRVRALHGAAWLATDQGDYADAAALLAECLGLSRELGDTRGEGVALAQLGRSRIASGHPAEGVPSLDQGLAILRAVGHPLDLTVALVYWGLAALFTDQPALACGRLAEALDTCRRLGLRSLGARTLVLLACAHIELDDLGAARAALSDALPTSIELGDRWVIPQEFVAFAGIVARQGKPRQALRLAGFAAAYCEAHDFSVPNAFQGYLERWLAPAKLAAGSAAAGLFAEGKQMPLEQAVACALSVQPDDTRRAGRRNALTKRELDVARLVAQGLTNRQIADR
ncbi:MAG: helix-turn-helix domain-containing protein, partial [Chloroflexi bacterium]|nr:helix-turn-helix domain-containing protein [Chloroflexota bacterium]